MPKAALLTLMVSLLAPTARAEGEGVLELTVMPDAFARFDHTRWRIDTQIGMPYPAAMYAMFNDEVQFVALDARMVMACDLDGAAVRGRQEVICVIEDAAVSLVPWLKQLPERAVNVVQDADEALTGLRVQLQVSEDGRVLDVGLLGEPQTNRRIVLQYENLRQIVLRAVLGFHMRSPEQYVVGQEWVERNTRLLTLPAFQYSSPAMRTGASGLVADERDTPASGVLQSQLIGTGSGLQAFGEPRRISSGAAAFGGFSTTEVHPHERLLAAAGYGRSTVANRMDTWRGKYVVQSTGEGSVDMGTDFPVVFMGDLSSVAVYDPSVAYMTERRWTVKMAPTASSPFANGVTGWSYWHVGSMFVLGQDEPSDVGSSEILGDMSPPRGQLFP
jgi:hypothetical protein